MDAHPICAGVRTLSACFAGCACGANHIYLADYCACTRVGLVHPAPGFDPRFWCGSKPAGWQEAKRVDLAWSGYMGMDIAHLTARRSRSVGQPTLSDNPVS